MTERIRTRTGLFWIDDEGFVRAEVFDGAEMTIEDARESAQAVQSLRGDDDVPRPLLADVTKLRLLSREARILHARETGLKYTAMAIVGGLPVSRALVNFAFSLTKPTIPTRLFSTVEDARAWLREQSSQAAQP